MRSVSEQCQEAIEKYNLLQHPFYVAWSEGSLPAPALRDYAREYGVFIRTIAEGWDKVGEARIAKVEQGHSSIWQRTFAAGLDTSISEPATQGVMDLVDTAHALFADVTTALGALYAFEFQQPHTAGSKLKGLREHYSHLPEKIGEYFRVHETDFAEPALLASKMDALDERRGAQAVSACSRMAAALYEALTAIYEPYAAEVAM